jgi:hypothetical protein
LKTLLLITFFTCVSFTSFGSESTSCSILQSIVSCGGVSIQDNGCNITCAILQGYESLCNQSECHELSSEFDYICNDKNTVCIHGLDGHQYTYERSTCFCD